VRWWTASKRGTVVAVRGRVVETIKRALTEAEIDLPFPTRVVLLQDQTQGHMQEHMRQRTAGGDRRRERQAWPGGEGPPRARLLEEAAGTGAPDEPQVRRREGSRH
jgi:small conductance mechanosensitive channel